MDEEELVTGIAAGLDVPTAMALAAGDSPEPTPDMETMPEDTDEIPADSSEPALMSGKLLDAPNEDALFASATSLSPTANAADWLAANAVGLCALLSLVGYIIYLLFNLH